jgi:phage/plasmid primase-like uncharacterized protein
MLGAAAADRQATAAEQGVMAEAEQEAETLRQPRAEQTALAAAVVEHGLGLLGRAVLVSSSFHLLAQQLLSLVHTLQQLLEVTLFIHSLVLVL